MSLLFASEIPDWVFQIVPEWIGTSLKLLVVVAGVVTLLGIVARTPYINRPVKWLWRHLVSEPIGGWSKRMVTDVVNPKLESQNTQIAVVTDFIEVARDNQESIKAALKNLHECVDRRAAESNERIEKLTEYAEEVLAEAVGAKERIRQLYRALEVPVFETDAMGHCTYINPAYSKLTGLSVEDALGEGWVEALAAEDRVRVFKAWSSATSSKIDFNSLYRFRNVTTGVITQVRGSAKPLHDGRGNVVGWVGTLDVTDPE